MGHEPENTLASIRKAIELGAPCIEVDVYNVDGHLVLFHDERLERTTNGVGSVTEQSFDYLRSLDAGNGQRIPTLGEACAETRSKACINIELKGPDTALPVAEMIAELIRGGWKQEDILVSSFDRRQLEIMRGLNQGIRLGVSICGLPLDDARFAKDLGALSVHPALQFVDRRFVDEAHSRDLRVYVYTVDRPEDIARMHALGVDGVFTNYPERVLADYSQKDMSGGWA